MSGRLSPNSLRRLASDLGASAEDELEAEAARALAAGARRMGRYVLLEEVGRGSGGRVHRAYDPTLRRQAAVKVLATGVLDEAARGRLEREVVALAAVAHPGVVQVYDTGVEDGELWFAMEWLAQGSLEDALAAGPLALEAALAHVRAVGEALVAVHAAGLLHLDVKPANVLLAEGRARLADFGAVERLLPEGARRDARPLGTRGYMAPEQARGDWTELDPRADVYGLASLLVALVSGGPTDEAAEGALPVHLRAVVCRARAASRDERTADVRALLAALEPRRRPRRWLFFGALAASLAAFAWLRPWERAESQRSEGYAESLRRLEPRIEGATPDECRTYLTARAGIFFETFSFHPIDLVQVLALAETERARAALERLAAAGDAAARYLLGRGAPPAVRVASPELDLWCAARGLVEHDERWGAQRLRELLGQEATALPAALLLAVSLLAEEDVPEAVIQLAGLEDPAAERLRAVCRLAQEGPLAALDDLRAAAASLPVMWTDAGLAELALEDPAGAAESFARCLAAHPTCVAARHHLAVARWRQGREEEALAELEAVCDLAEEAEWDASSATDWTLLSRSSFVLLWPSAHVIEGDPWLSGLRASPGYAERVRPRLPR